MNNLKEIIRKKLKEMSATNQGGASFNAGNGETYATPFAFSKKSKLPKYYYKLGYQLVPKKIKGSGLQTKKLFEEESLNEINDFQKRRLAGLDEIETLMNAITPLVSNAKNETIELYSSNAGSYDITQPIEIVLSYLREIKTLLTTK